MSLEVKRIDYSDETDARSLVYLLDAYAQDPMGGGHALGTEVKENLAHELLKLPHAFSIIAYVDSKPVGLINCFEAFSTFACKPLVNIHDLMVLEEYRGQGISQKMLIKVEEIAREKQCCKITIEVLSKNENAKASYSKYGFSNYQLDTKMGHALFWEKEIV